MNKKHQWHYILMATIIVLTVFFRFFKLPTIPYGMSSLETKTALSSISIKDNPSALLSLSRDYDNNIVYGSLQYISISILGNNVLGARLTSAILGLILVWLIYYFTNRFFHQKAALWAMLAVSINFSAIHFARLSMATNLVPILSIASLILFFEIFINNNSSKKYYLGLIVLNILSLYLYTQFSWLIVAEIIGIAYKIWGDKKDTHSKLDLVLLLSLIFLFIAKIIFTISSSGISALISGTFLDSSINGGNSFTSLLGSVYHSIRIFLNSSGVNPEYGIANMPSFNTFFTISLLLGLIYIIKNKKYPLYYQTIIILFVSLLMASLNPINGTNLIYLYILMPIMFIIIGIGASTMQSFLKHKMTIRNNHIITPALLGACVALSICLTFIQYFYNWSQDYQVANIYQTNALTLSVKELSDTDKSQYIVYSTDIKSRPYDLLNFTTLGKNNVQIIDINELISLDLKSTKNSTFYILASNGNDIDQVSTRIKQKYTNIKAESIMNDNDKIIYYKIKPL